MKIEHWLAPENIGFVAVGIVIGAVALIGAEAACDADVAARVRPASALPIAAPSQEPSNDQELLRCAKLRIEEAADPACKELWAKQRRKFLNPGRPPEPAEKPLDMFPTLPEAPDGASPKRAKTPKSE